MPKVLERVKLCKISRENSTDKSTRKLAETPHLFREQNNPKSFIAIPLVSSENRKYIPMDFLDDKIIAGSNIYIIPDANIYHFGVLTSNVHMAWMRLVAGRLKSDYRYSKDTLYNNFPWPVLSKEHKEKIEKTAMNILEARNLYTESSLATLYDEILMPSELRKAHQENDKAVMEAYGFNWRKMTESDCVTELIKLYTQYKNREG